MDSHDAYFESQILQCTRCKSSPKTHFFPLTALSWNLLRKRFHLHCSLHLRLCCKKGSEQFQRLHLTSESCWSEGGSVPWKEKHLPHFQGKHNQWTSPVPSLPSCPNTAQQSWECNADNAAQPGCHAATTQRMGPEPQRKMVAAKPHVGKRPWLARPQAFRKCRPVHIPPDRSQGTQLTWCTCHQCGERVSEELTTSSYTHTDTCLWVQIAFNLGPLNAFHQVPSS